MSAQPTLPAVWAAVQEALRVAAVDVPVIWKWQNAPQPRLDYAALSLGGFIVDGVDYVVEQPARNWAALTEYAVGARVLHDTGPRTYTCTVAGTSAGAGGPTGTGSGIVDGSCEWDFVAAGAEVALVVGGVREVALQLEVWSAAVVDEIAQPTAMATCEAIVGKLRLPTARNALRAVGVTPFDPGPVNWVPSIVATKFRGRASCDVRCRVPARALTEYTTFISSLTVGVRVGAITFDVEAP